jgi:phosphoenolpyruvate synthase/pyruvate phosphate dikinase
MLPSVLRYPSVVELGGCGAKAETTAALWAAGFQVPPGVAVSAQFAASILGADPGSDIARIQQRIRGADPHAVVDGVLAELPGDRLMVRSSSLCEDAGDQASYGVYRSGACGRTDLGECVLDCLSAAFEPAVLAYKERLGLPIAEYPALLVQQYVDGELSGVLLTRDIARRVRHQMLLEVTAGPCSAVTSGAVTPSTYARDRSGGPVDLVAGVDGFATHQLHPLFDLGLAIADALGYQVDIEFTVAAGRPVVLQARRLPGGD